MLHSLRQSKPYPNLSGKGFTDIVFTGTPDGGVGGADANEFFELVFIPNTGYNDVKRNGKRGISALCRKNPERRRQ